MSSETDWSKTSSRFDFTLLLIPVLVVLTITPFESIDRFNGLKLVTLAAMIVLCIFFVIKDRRLQKVNSSWLDLALIFFMIFSLVSFFMSPFSFESQFFGKLGRDAGFLAYLLFILLFMLTRYIRHENSFEVFIYFLIAASIPVQIYALIQILDLDPLEGATPESWIFSFLGNPNHLSSFLGIIFLLNFYLMGLRRWLIPALANMLSILVILGFNTSLQGFIIILFGLWFLLIWQIKNRVLFFTAVFLGIMLPILLSIYSLFNLKVLPVEINMLQEGTFLRRKELWLVAVLALREAPFFGHGYSSYESIYFKYRTTEMVERVGTNRASDSPHNEILELLVNGGFLLGATWLVIVLTICIRLIKQLRLNSKKVNANHDALTFVGIIFLGSLIHNSVSAMSVAINSILMVSGGLIFHYCNFPTQTINESVSQEIKSKHKLERINVFPVFAFVSILALIFTLLPFIRNMQLTSAINQKDLQKSYSAVSSFPKDVDRYVLLARLLIRDEKFDDAKFVLEEAKTKFPNQPVPIGLLLTFNLTEAERTDYVSKFKEINPLFDYKR